MTASDLIDTFTHRMYVARAKVAARYKTEYYGGVADAYEEVIRDLRGKV